MRLVANAGELARALALAAVKLNEADVKRLPVLGAVHITTATGAAEIIGNILDFTITVKAKVEIPEPGAIAVNGAALLALATSFSADAKITITGGDVTTITCGRSRYRLPQIPLGDLPLPLALDDITGEVVLEGTDLLRLLSTLATASTDQTRYYLNGALLQSVGDDLVAVSTDGKQLMRVSTPAAMFSTGHDLILPLKAALTLRKLVNKTSPDDVTLCRSNKLLAIRTTDFVFVSKLVTARSPITRASFRKRPVVRSKWTAKIFWWHSAGWPLSLGRLSRKRQLPPCNGAPTARSSSISLAMSLTTRLPARAKATAKSRWQSAR